MNTEHIEKFVNAIACDLEEGGFRQISGTTLRRSLTEAVSAALPLLEAGNPVSELVEQQGVGAPDCCEECGRRTFHNHPDGYICLHCKLIVGSRPQDAHFALDALVAVGHVEQGKVDQALAIGAALAATGKQQVGEKQGGARAQFEAWAKNHLPLHRDRWDGYAEHATGVSYAAWYAGWRAALAARQPVGEPVFVAYGPISMPPVPHGQVMPPDDRTGLYPVAHDDEAMQDYAREAVEADREKLAAGRAKHRSHVIGTMPQCAQSNGNSIIDAAMEKGNDPSEA